MRERVMKERVSIHRAFLVLIAVALLPMTLWVGSCRSSAEAPKDAARIVFTSEDGVELSGYLFGSGDTVLILSHMYPADQSSWYSIARESAEKGYAVLTFDFRGYGRSGGSKDIEHIDLDLRAALEEVKARGVTSVVLVGASMGGTAALRVAAEQPTAGVVTISAPVEFKGLSAEDAVTRVKAPKLFMAAEEDVGADNARALHEAALPPKDLVLLPGSEHGTDLFSGRQGEDARRHFFGFLSDVLKGSPGE